MDVTLLEKLAVRARTARLSEFFTDFDKLHVKRITPDQAVRAIEAAGLRLTPAEQVAVRGAYATADGYWDYASLLADVDDVRPAGFFESRPHVDPAATSPGARFSFLGTTTATCLQPRAVLGPEEERELDRVLRAMRYEVSVRTFSLAQAMQQYDVARRGAITAPRFKRELLACFRRLEERDAALLARAYATADGQVRYVALHADVTPAEAPTGIRPFTKHDGPPSPNVRTGAALAAAIPAPEEHEGVAVLLRFLYERRVRCEELFSDFDRLRKGTIPRANFLRALGALRVPGVSPRQLEAVADRYVVASDVTGDSIEWRRFCAEADGTGFERGLEADPLRVPGAPGSPTALARSVATSLNPRFMRPALTPREEETLGHVLSQLRFIVARERLTTVKEALLAFDPGHEGFMTLSRFERVLASFRLLPPVESDRALLMRYYSGSEKGPHAGMVEYRGFLRDIGLD